MEHFCQLELTALDRQADHLRRAAEARLIRQAKQARAGERLAPAAPLTLLAPTRRFSRLRPALSRLQAGLHALRLGRLAPRRTGHVSRRYGAEGAAGAPATIRVRLL